MSSHSLYRSLIKMKSSIIIAGCFLLSILACRESEVPEFSEVRYFDHPSINGGQPYLAVGQDGTLYSSWLEYLNDSLVGLNYAFLEAGRWSLPQLIAQGENWFVNWADFPSIVVNGDWMAAHWLQYRGAGVYQYDVQMAIRKHGADTWAEPITPHSDGVAAEHGFASMTSIDQDHILAVWLDGRNTANEGSDHAEHAHGQGAMTLRSALIDQNGYLTQEFELDNRVCDCCQTDIAMAKSGPVVVYRNRSEDEIRDIYITSWFEGEWQEPHPVYSDGWKIGGCPVNGPAIATSDDFVAVAWFTMANDSARVKLSFSHDGGHHFETPLTISDGNPLGRVDLVFIDEHRVLITWMENIDKDEAEILGCTVRKDLMRSEPFKLVSTSPARNSGFPRIAMTNSQVYLSWTEVSDGGSRVKSAEVIFD